MSAPHNLFTLPEILQALWILQVGALQPDHCEVRVEWSGSRISPVPVDDLQRGINSLDEVEKMTLEWTYADGSTVSGRLINRPEPGRLRIEHGGQAELATQNCLNFLSELRPQRARARGFLVGRWPYALLMLFIAVVVVALLSSGAQFAAPQTTVETVELLVTVLMGFMAHLFTNAVFRRLDRRAGGTRLAHPPQAHRQVLTAELGTLVTVLGVPIAMAGVLVAALAVF